MLYAYIYILSAIHDGYSNPKRVPTLLRDSWVQAPNVGTRRSQVEFVQKNRIELERPDELHESFLN